MPIIFFELTDHKGVPRPYNAAVVESPLAAFAVDVSRLDKDATYRVSLLHTGEWLCNCPDFHYRQKRSQGELCKHLERVLKLYEDLHPQPKEAATS